jgi:hypothetical protein
MPKFWMVICVFVCSQQVNAGILVWSSEDPGRQLTGVRSILVDGMSYDANFVIGTIDENFYNDVTNEFEFTFDDQPSAFLASAALSAFLTASSVATQDVFGISSFGSGYIETLHTARFEPNAFGGPVWLIDSVSASGVSPQPYDASATTWAVLDTPPLGSSDNVYTNGSRTYAAWTRSASVPAASTLPLFMTGLMLLFAGKTSSLRPSK